jgi:hypothetical protein
MIVKTNYDEGYNDGVFENQVATLKFINEVLSDLTPEEQEPIDVCLDLIDKVTERILLARKK